MFSSEVDEAVASVLGGVVVILQSPLVEYEGEEQNRGAESLNYISTASKYT
jgi:hypothetical protein